MKSWHKTKSLARTGYFATHYAASLALLRWYGGQRSEGHLTLPSWRRYLASIEAMIDADSYDLEHAHYIDPHPGTLPNFESIKSYYGDFKAFIERQKKQDIVVQSPNTALPQYYQRAFHFQPNGWLSDQSAVQYEFSVEVLFLGLARVMRRRGLGLLRQHFYPQRRVENRILDIGSGDGSFTDLLEVNFPTASVFGLDLSEYYLRKARKDGHQKQILGLAEQLPIASEHVDVVTSIFVMHELPSRIRQQVFQDAYRTLKKGGHFLITDSLQYSDDPAMDGLLERFPQLFHEPFFEKYCQSPLETLAQDEGFTLYDKEVHFLSKSLLFVKN